MDDKEQRWSAAMRAERHGDRFAYESLLKELAVSLRQMVRPQLRRMHLSAAETEDVVQEVLIAVHARRHHWDPERPLIPWLNAIARYKLIDASRRLRREASRRIELRDEDWSHLFISEPLDISRSAMDVERVISDLPKVEQAAVRGIGLEGMSVRETAERLGSSEGAVRVAFHRSIRKLFAAAKKRI